jgi:hypothetical protein
MSLAIMEKGYGVNTGSTICWIGIDMSEAEKVMGIVRGLYQLIISVIYPDIHHEECWNANEVPELFVFPIFTELHPIVPVYAST